MRPDRFALDRQPQPVRSDLLKTTIEALEEAGLRDSVKIMIGGAPVTAAFAQQIGADAYAPDAASAVDVAREMAAR